MSAVYAIGMTISAFMLYSSLECAGNYSSLLHVVSVCVCLLYTSLQIQVNKSSVEAVDEAQKKQKEAEKKIEQAESKMCIRDRYRTVCHLGAGYQ